MERIALVGQFIAVGHNRAAVATVEVLAGLEAETARVTPRADFAASPLGQVRLASVFDHRQLVLAGHCQHRIEVDRGAAQVHGNDRCGAVRDRGLDLAGVNLHGFGVGIHEDGQRVVQQDHVYRGNKRVGCDDDLITG